MLVTWVAQLLALHTSLLYGVEGQDGDRVSRYITWTAAGHVDAMSLLHSCLPLLP